jgi:hypothetical protein
MDLKLKDELTKLLIESPGISISQLAKKTNNYYSYTHKILSEMEKHNLVVIEKTKKGNKTITICRLSDDYKHDWVMSAKKFFKALVKDAEVKTAFLLMYGFLIFTLFTQGPAQEQVFMAMETGDLVAAPAVVQTQPINFGLIIVMIIPVLIGVWFLRRKY